MRARSIVVLLALALGAAGCGSEQPVSPVTDTVPPAAVLDITATAVASGIRVEWSESSEPDVAGYRVFRSVNGDAAAQVGWVSTNEFLDTAPGAGSNRYEVAAVDASGNASPRAVSAFVVTPTPDRDGGPALGD